MSPPASSVQWQPLQYKQRPSLLAFRWRVGRCVWPAGQRNASEPPHHRKITNFTDKPVGQNYCPCLIASSRIRSRCLLTQFYRHPMWIDKVEGTKWVPQSIEISQTQICHILHGCLPAKLMKIRCEIIKLLAENWFLKSGQFHVRLPPIICYKHPRLFVKATWEKLVRQDYHPSLLSSDRILDGCRPITFHQDPGALTPSGLRASDRVVFSRLELFRLALLPLQSRPRQEWANLLKAAKTTEKVKARGDEDQIDRNLVGQLTAPRAHNKSHAKAVSESVSQQVNCTGSCICSKRSATCKVRTSRQPSLGFGWRFPVSGAIFEGLLWWAWLPECRATITVY